ncbi:MAG: glycosyltransferase [Candidatus Stahlbacteria bacterium]|nr:MAG: glycosyltransferase [Candidatus Stahlbacteria bacterium]
MSNKVIFLIATYNQAKLLEDCLKYCNRLEPQPDKYIFCENNSIDDTLDVIKRFKRPKELIRFWVRDDAVKTLGNPYGIIAIARQMLLKRARQLDSDYAIFIDSDITLLYKYFIDQITCHEKDIVGAPYLRPFPEGMFLASKWDRGNRKLWYKKSCKGFQRCTVTSGGCLCLSRKAIQDKRLFFDPPIWNKKRKASEDFSYCIRAGKVGYKIWIDCNLQVGHYATASDYKPWMIKRDKNRKNIGYIDFSYK